MENEVNTPEQGNKKKVWIPIVIVIVVLAAVLAALFFGMHRLGQNGSQPAPVLLAGSSHYEMYETRPDSVLLTYSITLRNDTDEDLRDFALRATLQSDYKNGYLLSPEATVRQWGEKNSTFTLAAGETQTFDLILTAQYHKTTRTASGDLPQLYAIYPDGSEGVIKILDEGGDEAAVEETHMHF